MNRKCQAAFVAGRLRAVALAPYFAAALYRLRPRLSPGLRTVGVDRTWQVYLDPQTITDWASEELAAVLIHEINHLIRGHHQRIPPETSPTVWNVAGDLEINDDLIAAGMPLPGAALTPERFGLPEGLTAEAYHDLIDVRPVVMADGDCGSAAHGVPGDHEHLDPDGAPTALELERIRHEVADAVAARGDAPAGLRRWAESVRNPIVPWPTLLARILRRRVSATRPGQIDWIRDRPSRRHPGSRVLHPRLAAFTGDIAIVVDTSGSITSDELSQELAEVIGVVRAHGAPVTVVACDVEVTVTRNVTRPDDVVLVGGGGTSMGNGLAAAAALRPAPSLIVVLTDGWTEWPEGPPSDAHVVVVLSDERASPPRWATSLTRPSRRRMRDTSAPHDCSR